VIIFCLQFGVFIPGLFDIKEVKSTIDIIYIFKLSKVRVHQTKMPPIYRFFNSMSLEVLRSFGIYICTLFKSGQCENMLKRKPFDNIHSIKFLLWFGFVLFYSFTFLLF